EKLPMLQQANAALEKTLNPQRLRPAPTDAENVRALTNAAGALRNIANEEAGDGPTAARRVADQLTRIAKGDAALRTRTEAALVPALKTALQDLRTGLKAERVTLDNLPADLRRDWIAADGRALVDVSPKGDPNDNEILRRFATAVLAVEPAATGSPVSLQESGRTVVRAFIEAGVLSLVSIMILLWIVLRRFSDVLLTLGPPLLAGPITLENFLLVGLPLNFPHTSPLPLLP